MGCHYCGSGELSKIGISIVCQNCGWPQSSMQFEFEDGWDFCEIRVCPIYEPSWNALIPFKGQWMFLAVGKKNNATFLAGSSISFRGPHGKANDDAYIQNVRLAQELWSDGSNQAHSRLCSQLNDLGWQKTDRGPQWYRQRFRRRAEHRPSLAEVISQYVEKVGSGSHEAALALQLIDQFGYGADVHARSQSLATPLHYAAGHGLHDLVILLLDSGAEPRLGREVGIDAVEIANRLGHQQLGSFLTKVMFILDEGLILAPGESYQRIAELRDANVLESFLYTMLRAKDSL